MRFLRALANAFTGVGWVLSPPIGPFDVGFVVPLPRKPQVDPLTVPLTEMELAIFQRLISAEWRQDL